MTHLAIFIVCVAGFAALALAGERQQEEQLGRLLPAARTSALRVAGWGALAAALALAVHGAGWGIGLVAYSGHTSAAAGLVYLGLVVGTRTVARRP